MTSKLEVLIKAYVELVQVWSRMTPGDNCMRVWKATQFLERLVKEELKKCNTSS